MLNPFTCDLVHSFDPSAKTWTAKATLKVEACEEARMLLREIPERIWRTLCFIALRMTPEGVCRATADLLAQDMGITKAQAVKRLLELSEWESRGRKILFLDGDGYCLTPEAGHPSLLGMAGLAQNPATETPKPQEPLKSEEPPTTQDLTRELTRKLHTIPGVQVLRGNYALIGRTLATYGYEAVSEALDDLLYEFDLRDQMGQPVPTNGELGRLLMQRAAWNVKRLDAQGRSEAKGSLWDYYAWNEAGDQLVPTVQDPPFTAIAIGGKILIGTKLKEVCT